VWKYMYLFFKKKEKSLIRSPTSSSAAASPKNRKWVGGRIIICPKKPNQPPSLSFRTSLGIHGVGPVRSS